MKEIITLLELVRESFCLQQKKSLKLSCDADVLRKLIIEQELVALVVPVLKVQEDQNWKVFLEKLYPIYNQEIHKAITQQFKIEQFLEQIEAVGMDCLPVKGWIMKGYYEDGILRSMTDFDVLLKSFDATYVKSLMESMKYEPRSLMDDHHELYIQKPYMVIELHKSLSGEAVKRDMPLVDSWLRDMWNRVVLIEGKKHIYQLRQEDVYIYHIIHLCKHFQQRGTGIRPIIDIYVFLNKVGEYLDWNYIESTLKNMNLWKFENAMRNLSEKSFSLDKSSFSKDEKTLLEFVFTGGLYGDSNATTTFMVAKKNHIYFLSRMQVIGRVVFAPASKLKGRYPILDKYPIFLPVIWVIRCLRIMFNERYKITAIREGSKQEKVDEIRSVLKAAGLD